MPFHASLSPSLQTHPVKLMHENSLEGANGNSIELNASPCQGVLGRLAQVMSLPCRNHTKKIQEKITNRWHNPQVHYKSLQTVPCHAPLSPSLKTHPVMFIHENNLQ